MDRPPVTVLRGDALAVPLADESVDLVVTSPPYFGLRSYQDGGEHYDGQIGAEATPAEFVDALVAATREMVRVLKPSGSIWVNLGDAYYSGKGAPGRTTVDAKSPARTARRLGGNALDGASFGIGRKSLVGVPWRYALRCIDDLGLILRAEVIWSKPNGLPESVTDRVRRSHETWFAFEKSGVVEAAAERFPFCPLCGRPVDARSTLVARLKECDRSGETGGMPDEVGPHDLVQADGVLADDGDVQVGLGCPPIPELVVADTGGVEDGVQFVEDQRIAVVDADAKMRTPVASVAQRDRALAVDDAGEPSEFCECVGHPLIVDDEPWIPQSLAAEIAQMVADGNLEPQQAADFLSGDYVRTHSVWFHFTRSPRYFSAVDEIREEHARSWGGHRPNGGNTYATMKAPGEKDANLPHAMPNPLGKLPGSVWTVPTQPLKVPAELGIDHFAAFPMEWPRRIIQGWSPTGVCTACGEGRRPVVLRDETDPRYIQSNSRQESHERLAVRGVSASSILRTGLQSGQSPATRITGYACACPDVTAPTRPAVVLDPFGGTGTTALVAHAFGRHGISLDMSADYCRLAQWRTTDPDQLAAALQVEKPRRQVEGQTSLFDLVDDEGAA